MNHYTSPKISAEKTRDANLAITCPGNGARTRQVASRRVRWAGRVVRRAVWRRARGPEMNERAQGLLRAAGDSVFWVVTVLLLQVCSRMIPMRNISANRCESAMRTSV